MGAPKGNQFWKLRSKHGRDRIIQDPETLAKASDEYFQWCIDNPIEVKDFKSTKHGIEEVYYSHPRVFTKEGLALFCDVAQWRVIAQLTDVSEDFKQVVTRIEGIISNQKYTYAVIGVFNSNIVARDLGLADHKDITSEGKPITYNVLPASKKE